MNYSIVKPSFRKSTQFFDKAIDSKDMIYLHDYYKLIAKGQAKSIKVIYSIKE